MLAQSFEGYGFIQSFSEIGDVTLFENPKKQVAYAGLDPSVFELGKYKASINRITKRGSSRLRQSLYIAVQYGLARNRNKKLTDCYQRKRD